MYLLEAKAKALELGATHYRIYYIQEYREFLGRTNVPFSYYFFNDEDKEVAFYSVTMGPLVGMTINEKPRTWSVAFKTHENYSEPLDFETHGVYKKFTKEECLMSGAL